MPNGMRALVMGILNVTPDSFSDGGSWPDPEAAAARGMEMVGEGADIVDVGGESTRPGAEPVPIDEELRRVIPVIEALSPAVRISVDTRKAEVARAAVKAGATLINDVSSSLAPVAADTGTGWIAMHMQGDPLTMQVAPSYEDVVRDVRDFLADRAREAIALGVTEVWIDPGIGFGKTTQHNLDLLANLDTLAGLGHPVAVGTSRKRFLGEITKVATPHTPGQFDGEAPGPTERMEASVATAVAAVLQGAAMVRVHDMAETVQALRIAGDEVSLERAA